jgi:S-formylglutathione hydrolase FrmB
MDMGGYGAFRQALAHPEVFGKAAAFDAPLDIHKYYRETAFPYSPDFCMEQVFGAEEKFKGGENDLFALAGTCATKAKMPGLLLVNRHGGSLEKEFMNFSEYLKKIGFSGIHTVARPEKDLNFYEGALNTTLDSLERGEL